VPLVEPGLNLAAEQVIEHSAYGALLGSEGNRGPDAAPQGVYRCQNGEWIALAVESDAHWRALAAVLPEASLAQIGDRRARLDEIDAALARACAQRSAGNLEDELLAAGIPAQKLVNCQAVMPHPQLEHRAYYQWLEHPHTGRARYPGLPFVGLADGHPHRPPPTLGQHNREVLAGELGITEDELARWEREDIIGTRPGWLKSTKGDKP
jgi:crotonobetainyl-CoA:carnitine CoA-transferase CaiB-like acyl-CoA transferase